MNERVFTTELIKSFKEKPEWVKVWGYKIPDAVPSDGNRFIPKKPFDIIGNLHGEGFAIECKQLKSYRAFSIKEFSDNQIENLDKYIYDSEGMSFVFLNIRINEPGNRVNECIIFEWEYLKSIWMSGSIKKHDLMDFDSITGHKGMFDLSLFYKNIKNGKRTGILSG